MSMKKRKGGRLLSLIMSNQTAYPSINIKEYVGLTADSRKVKPSYLFAALPGSQTDGRDYINAALENGAAAILAPVGTKLPATSNALLIEEENPRQVFARLAATFYEAQPETIAAVTGTNGKSSVVFFTQQLWQALGKSAAFIGTLGTGTQKGITSGNMTTPDPVTLHETLENLAGEGVTHLAMEASSHGLEQYRLDGVKAAVAGFTSFSRDHLDYHKDMAEYLEAKSGLFARVLGEEGAAVLNADIPEYKALTEICKKRGIRTISYGRQGEILRLLSAKPTPQGQDISLEIEGNTFDLTLPLIGSFQVMNALCAFGLVWANAPRNTNELITALKNLKNAPGRLQHVPTKTGDVYVDYAHTPDALETVLKAVRPHTNGRLICAFGCGGDRDKGKRSMMGDVAAQLADVVIVTDDNPRSEEPSAIRTEILQGAGKAKELHEIAGRRDAIRFAVEQLVNGDVFVLAGKGHEQGQIFADHTEPFDDVTEVTRVNNGVKA